jgi:undecaprenyl diphosphate synthase
VEPREVPRHVAIIMDGNGRWAQERLLPRMAGHRKGASTVRRICYACADRGIKVLTLYMFSTENWKRAQEEVGSLMGLIERTLRKELAEFHRRGVKVRVSGRVDQLPAALQQTIHGHLGATEEHTDLILNMAVNYGGRAEIVDAARSLARDVQEGRLAPDDITEETFASRLYTAGLPDPDLLIRTGGDMRISNFLLWQLAYTEIYVTPTLWPAFTEEELDRALGTFSSRERRFGGVLGEVG